MANIYDENYQPKRAYRALQADLQIAGPPFVEKRVPQRPTKLGPVPGPGPGH
jgi:endo-1,4-beta-xylanase